MIDPLVIQQVQSLIEPIVDALSRFPSVSMGSTHDERIANRRIALAERLFLVLCHPTSGDPVASTWDGGALAHAAFMLADAFLERAEKERPA